MMIHLYDVYVTVDIAAGLSGAAIREAIDGWCSNRIESAEDGFGILEVIVHNVHEEVSIHDTVNQLIGAGVRIV